MWQCNGGPPGCYARASSAGSTCGRPSWERPVSLDVGAVIFTYLLPIKQRVEYKMSCHVQNVYLGHAIAYLSDMLTACADVPSLSMLRTSSSSDYVIPRTRLKLSERAFVVSTRDARVQQKSYPTRTRSNFFLPYPYPYPAGTGRVQASVPVPVYPYPFYRLLICTKPNHRFHSGTFQAVTQW